MQFIDDRSDISPMYDPPADGLNPYLDAPGAPIFVEEPGVFDTLVSLGSTLFGLLLTVVWIWMIVDCVRREPDRFFWLWIILFFPWFGSLVYFFARWLPSNQIRTPASLRWWTRRRELTQLETAARQIGNAHQFVLWGDGMREAGMPARAQAAYRTALDSEPTNLQALWGTAQVNMQQSEFDAALEKLQQLIEIDPQYKFGDVSLAYGRALVETGRLEDAELHLKQHVRRWRHPEAMYLLAELMADRGGVVEARGQLEALILDIDGSPKGIARKHRRWKSRAHRRLQRLTKEASNGRSKRP